MQASNTNTRSLFQPCFLTCYSEASTYPQFTLEKDIFQFVGARMWHPTEKMWEHQGTLLLYALKRR